MNLAKNESFVSTRFNKLNNSLFEPSLMFINQSDWINDEIRDDFLHQLINNLKFIDKYKITKVYWSDEFEVLLWGDPQIPPWRIDRDFKLQLVPIIYNLFNSNIELITPLPHKAEITPELEHINETINNAFLKIVHRTIASNERTYLCIGRKNKHMKELVFHYSCLCHSQVINPIAISDPSEWWSQLHLTENFWPQDTSGESVLLFREAIEITALEYFECENFVYEYDFERSFLKSLVDETKNKEEILFSLAKRLSMHQKFASSDKSLNDEPVKGDSDERRFRTSKENRIHYVYPSERKITFTQYYSEGEHDKAFRLK
jgi:hypothetical protein